MKKTLLVTALALSFLSGCASVPMESEENVQNEIDRYTFRIPGQATAYYYGYENLQALRAQTELKLKDKFNQQEYHDFLLAQGLLPPEVLSDAVDKNFIAPQMTQ